MAAPVMVLGSASPSRLAVLRQAGVDPVVHPADVDEDALRASLDPSATPEEVVCALASAKAHAVWEARAAHTIADSDDGNGDNALLDGDSSIEIIVGCDSMLLLDGELQGKPHTVEETKRRWRAQRGKRAELITGHCVITPQKTITKAVTTAVYFADASDADIHAYATSGEPLGCAGAFTLEARGGWLIDRIEGDPSSVIGISLPFLRQALYDCDLDVSALWNPAT